MEAIAAMMVVIVALTAFLGMLSYSDLSNEKEDAEIDYHFLNELSVVDGKITGDITDKLCSICEKKDLSKMKLDVKLLGPVYYDTISFEYGEEITDHPSYSNGTIRILSNDGRSLVATYEVVIFQ